MLPISMFIKNGI